MKTVLFKNKFIRLYVHNLNFYTPLQEQLVFVKKKKFFRHLKIRQKRPKKRSQKLDVLGFQKVKLLKESVLLLNSIRI